MFRRNGLVVLGSLLIIGALSGCLPGEDAMLEQNKQLVRRAFDEVWNKGNLDNLEEMFAADFVRHFPGMPELEGLDDFRESSVGHRASFPDWQEEVLHLIAENDLVAAQFRSTATHQGKFMGKAATGNKINIYEMTIFRIADGKIAEQWLIPDRLSLTKQLEVVIDADTSGE